MADLNRSSEAGSVQDSDPPYIDARSAGDRNMSKEPHDSNMNTDQGEYTDAASVTPPQNLADEEAAYVDASSSSPDGTFQDAVEEQKTEVIEAGATAEGPASETAPSTPDQESEGTILARSNSKTVNKHVYFILEKQDDFDELIEGGQTMQVGVGKYKGHTLARSNVNVAARAMMFERTKMSQYGVKTKAIEQDVDTDPIYDVPPALQAGEQCEAGGVDASVFTDDKNIYEINSDDDQSHGASAGTNPLQNFGGFESSGTYEVVEHMSLPQRAARTDVYELAKPLSVVLESDLIRHKDMSGSGGFMSCMQGTPRVCPDLAVVPSRAEIQTEYNRLNFNRKSRETSSPDEAGYNTLDRNSGPPFDPSTNEPIYEATPNSRYSTLDSDRLSDGSWGSSEFEVYSNDEEGYEAEADTPAPTKPLPRKPKHGGESVQGGRLLNKLKDASAKSPLEEDGNTVCLPVTINTRKHPPPALPPAPDMMRDDQRKRRCVIESTIDSERSYIDSLERIIQEYEKPVLEVIVHPKSHTRVVFKEAREILNHHKMFQIELSESVRNWHMDERIGDIFTASFSKSMLVDAYSMYVNNFAAAMDEMRTMQQNRPQFEEFLKMKEKTSQDRLSIFGLMVKPVQRFPQFIMLIQDLIKYTPPKHADRRSLQLALTELENVAHKLNERKRLSEQYFQAKQTMQLLPRQFPNPALTSGNHDKPRRLIRCDNFEQIDGEMDHMKSSSRRLILLNDFLVCVKIGYKNQDGYMMERYRLKWAARLSDMELKDTAMTPDMRSVMKMDFNRLKVLSAQLEKNEEDPFHLYTELRDMLHDLSVLGQVSTLMKSLKKNYQGHGLSDELLQEVVADLQRMIQIKDEQLRLVNSCSIILVDNSKADKPHYVMQTPDARIKSEWCVDFSMAKLALEKQNNPGWDRAPTAGEEDLEPVPALFMKVLPIDVPRHFTKMKCATPVFVPSTAISPGLGVQHLWVCSSSASRGQVSMVSLNSTRPALTEMFKACDCDMLCCEVVPGCGNVTKTSKFLFSEDTVWMANVHNEIVIFPVASAGGSTTTRDPLAVVRVPGRVTTIRFVDERMFCGLDGGVVLVYSRNDAGEWCIKGSRMLEIGRAPIKCQLVIEDSLWVACGHKVYVVEIDSLKMIADHSLSANNEQPVQQLVRCGVGVWVAYHNSAVLRLFHCETLENLQEMSVANTVNRVLAEKRDSHEAHDCVVTCLAASTGLLWIGTSLGLVVTLPLPRLSDGVPLYRGRPSVSYHAHRGPVRFIIPVHCSGGVMALYKSSSLHHSLRTRDSLRNKKRAQLEHGEAAADEKLLSSGTELEASHSSVKSKPKGKEAAEYIEVLPPKPNEIPRDKREGNTFTQRFKALKNGGFRRSTGLKGKRTRGQTQSFRTELANRIKSKTLIRSQAHAQSMFDLRADDTFEVEMFYENLLDVDDVVNEDNISLSELDDLSVRSDSSLTIAGGDLFGIQDRFNPMVQSATSFVNSTGAGMNMGVNCGRRMLQSLDLAGLGDNNKGKASSSSSTTGMTSPDTTTSPSVSVAPSQPTAPVSVDTNNDKSTSTVARPPSPHISLFRTKTMRKTSTSNAVMALSGGDGYVDLNTGNITARNEDASLLLWIYKF